MLEHGGRLLQAAQDYGIPAGQWLDLSTGINPNGWPVPPIPPDVWTRLPEAEDGLSASAAAYYGAPAVLPLAGSQAAIQALPALQPPGRVGIPTPGYAEHAHAWRRAGHDVVALPPHVLPAATELDTVVIINPNNPTGHRFAVAELLALHDRLRRRGGRLVVDEAFMDCTPDQSLAPYSSRPGLVVLRSLGKFFGLAGARVGFTLAAAAWLTELEARLGPWPVAGPARWVAQQALADRVWQQATRAQLRHAGERLARLLSEHGLPPDGGTALFQRVLTPQAAAIQHALAQHGILVRRFEQPSALRFGLPADAAQWQRLAQALSHIDSQIKETYTCFTVA